MRWDDYYRGGGQKLFGGWVELSFSCFFALLSRGAFFYYIRDRCQKMGKVVGFFSRTVFDGRDDSVVYFCSSIFLDEKNDESYNGKYDMKP